MLDLFSWSLSLLIWKMAILLTTMCAYRNWRDEMRRAHSWCSGRWEVEAGSAAGWRLEGAECQGVDGGLSLTAGSVTLHPSTICLGPPTLQAWLWAQC